MTAAPTLELNNGVSIPAFGYGVFELDPAVAAERTLIALREGYRLIDTAAVYGNESEVGEAIAASALPREELFVTTKLWNEDQGFDSALRAFEASRARLGLDYVDLYLIHWPCPSLDRYVESWRALERIHAEGAARAIGVSNFNADHLERLLAETEVAPAVNQVELHPWFPQEELRAFHAEHGIVTEAWGPLGQGRGLLEESEIRELARAKGRTPAQVVLRWHLQLGNVVFPKSANPARIAENIDVFGFELSETEMRSLASVAARGGRLGADPEVFLAP